MSKIEKCPLNNEERKKHCLCETCLFVKRCTEEAEKVFAEIDAQKEITRRKGDNQS